MLDLSKPLITNTNQYWIFKYIFLIKNNINFFDNLTTQRRFFLRKDNLLNNILIKNQKQFTIKYSGTNHALFLSEELKNFYEIMLQPRPKVKHKELDSKNNIRSIFDFLKNQKLKYDEKSLRLLFKNFSYKTSTEIFKTNHMWALFDINFLKKERIYTKLKYSRVPQYDIVSGGAAALLAGFLGFLICEKFGFELADSGDFYFLFMYLVFLFFFCRTYLKLMNQIDSSWSVFSFKWIIYFYQIILWLWISFVKLIIK